MPVVFIKLSELYLLYTVAKENEEVVVNLPSLQLWRKIMQETGIRGIIVNNRIINVSAWKKGLGAVCCAQASKEEKWRFRFQEVHRQMGRPNL